MIRYKGGTCKWWHFYPTEEYGAGDETFLYLETRIRGFPWIFYYLFNKHNNFLAQALKEESRLIEHLRNSDILRQGL